VSDSELHIPNSSYLKSFKKSVGNSVVVRSRTEVSQRSFENDENRTPKVREKSQLAERNRSQIQQLQHMMQETDNSMEELLNSSINQFEKLIIHEEVESLEEQNHRLKAALSTMKLILKDKLEIALQKQKDELSKML
jgi:transposase